jgi:hypothetical protein
MSGSGLADRQRAIVSHLKTHFDPMATRSARSALRHGLSISVSSEPSLSAQAEAIAGRFAGPSADAATLERARRIGEAQVDLNGCAIRSWPSWRSSRTYRPDWFHKPFLRLLPPILSDRALTPSKEEAAYKIINLQPPVGDEKLAIMIDEQASISSSQMYYLVPFRSILAKRTQISLIVSASLT